MSVAAEIKEDVRFETKIGLIADVTRILREKPAGKRPMLQVFDIVARIVSYDAATLYLMNKRTNELDEAATRGKKVNLVPFLQFDQGTGLVAWVAQQKRTVKIPGRDPSSVGVRDHHDSVLLLPLTIDDEVTGVLCFSDPRPDAFDQEAERFLEVIADLVTLSLERTKRLREVEIKSSALERTHRELTEAQSGLIVQERVAVKDRLAAVSELAAAVAQEVDNPLSTIVGNAQIIELESALLPAKFSGQVRAIVEAARKISLITHKLLTIDTLLTPRQQVADTKSELNPEASKKE